MAKFIFLFQIIEQGQAPQFAADSVEADNFIDAVHKWENVAATMAEIHKRAQEQGKIPLNIPVPTFHLVQVSTGA